MSFIYDQILPALEKHLASMQRGIDHAALLMAIEEIKRLKRLELTGKEAFIQSALNAWDEAQK